MSDTPSSNDQPDTDEEKTVDFDELNWVRPIHEGKVISGRAGLLLVLLMVGLADVTLYHAEGYAGPAVFLIGAAALLIAGTPGRNISLGTGLITTMIILLSWRLSVNGWAMQVVVGLWLLCSLTLILRQQPPFILETVLFAAQCIPGGFDFYRTINRRMRESVLGPVDEGRPSRLVSILLPIVAVLTFGTIFIMANPDIVRWVSEQLGDLVELVQKFLFQFSPFEILFWLAVAWLTGGFLRPVVDRAVFAPGRSVDTSTESRQSPMYDAFRNTLLTVIVLFAAYLVFEFSTLWFRDLPEGFYYAGYAHEGAAWLTVALATATLMLSLIFRGTTLVDTRVSTLRRLAWIWSALNILLAIAVYNRMHIYIDFNGMTRMRTVGMLGITSVVGGFLLVLFKINQGRGFLWLIRRQLWVLGFVVYVYLVTPVDLLIHRYNVSRIMAGDLAPIVQITGHEVDDECLATLVPLCESNDKHVSLGIQAFLSMRFTRLEAERQQAKELGWTAWQSARENSYALLEKDRSAWDTFDNAVERQSKWTSLREYAYENWW